MKNDTWMLCRTPNILEANLPTPNPQEPHTVPFGFHMDDVKDLLNYSHALTEGLRVYEDPIFSPFKDGTKRVQSKEDEHLTISVSVQIVCRQLSRGWMAVGVVQEANWLGFGGVQLPMGGWCI